MNILGFSGIANGDYYRENYGLRFVGHDSSVALIADAIKDCSRRNDIVLDTFVGSGTTPLKALGAEPTPWNSIRITAKPRSGGGRTSPVRRLSTNRPA